METLKLILTCAESNGKTKIQIFKPNNFIKSIHIYFLCHVSYVTCLLSPTPTDTATSPQNTQFSRTEPKNPKHLKPKKIFLKPK